MSSTASATSCFGTAFSTEKSACSTSDLFRFSFFVGDEAP
jgi:hypothetical protein